MAPCLCNYSYCQKGAMEAARCRLAFSAERDAIKNVCCACNVLRNPSAWSTLVLKPQVFGLSAALRQAERSEKEAPTWHKTNRWTDYPCVAGGASLHSASRWSHATTTRKQFSWLVSCKRTESTFRTISSHMRQQLYRTYICLACFQFYATFSPGAVTIYTHSDRL